MFAIAKLGRDRKKIVNQVQRAESYISRRFTRRISESPPEEPTVATVFKILHDMGAERHKRLRGRGGVSQRERQRLDLASIANDTLSGQGLLASPLSGNDSNDEGNSDGDDDNGAGASTAAPMAIATTMMETIAVTIMLGMATMLMMTSESMMTVTTPNMTTVSKKTVLIITTNRIKAAAKAMAMANVSLERGTH